MCIEPAAVLQTNAGVSSVLGALVQAMVGKYETSKVILVTNKVELKQIGRASCRERE